MISIIIPVYNEEKTIKKTLVNLAYNEKSEVIVVDGESQDKTVEFAKRYPAKVIQCVKNRAAQMNEGAKISRGEILLFLHADSILEAGSLEAIENCLKDGYDAGCLKQRIMSERWIYRFIEGSGNIRAKLFGIFYGDQAIFTHRDLFFELSGFADVPLFEDVLFSKKLKREGATKVLSKNVFVSARRWERKGVIKATFIFWLLTLGFILGISLQSLKRLYPDIR